ncbi:MAG: OmpA family protein [Chromatiales bacterium]|nr:OmpA family protein [Chromatiales bacterium]MDH3895131.1 OmpA family protein [Chromatiales bacterium]MDH3930790.1 OmpA family protein [Chromatiales bacterium]MDH3945715.1 OmpA family protein [Chromatiales bacterium]MDH4014924.1 OmpA family protein [Chromatiales bacterium]
MKKIIVFATLAALLASMQAEAGSRSTRPGESIGVVGGAIVGVAAAGPLGALFGGALGAYLGNSVEQAQKLDGVESELSANRSELAAARAEVNRSRRSQAEAERRLDELAVRLAAAPSIETLGRGIAFDVHFRTGESEVAESTGLRLRELAALLAQMPDLAVQLDGYADPRGDEKYNRDLSAERAEGIMKLLLDAGVEAERIASFGHGASGSTAAVKDLDAYAFDRRVSIRLVPLAGHGQVARSD